MCQQLFAAVTSKFDENEVIALLDPMKTNDWAVVFNNIEKVELAVAKTLNKRLDNLIMDLENINFSPFEWLAIKMRLENAVRKLPQLGGPHGFDLQCLQPMEGLVWALTTFWALTSQETTITYARRYCGETV